MTEEPLDPVHLHEASAPGRRRGARKRGGGLWPEGYSDQTVTGFLQDRPSGIQDRAYFASREASIRMRAESARTHALAQPCAHASGGAAVPCAVRARGDDSCARKTDVTADVTADVTTA